MHCISPVAGWTLDYIVALDSHRKGTAGDFLRASPERRQVVAALLSSKPLPSDPSEVQGLAALISEGGHHELLTVAYGIVPVGLRRALARSGAQPHQRSFYRALHHILTMSSQESIGRAIRQLEALDLTRLRIAQALPSDVCTADLVKLVGSVRMANDVGKLISLMTNAGLDRAALAQAFCNIRTETQLSQFWDRWTQKLPLPSHPVHRTAHYHPVTSGSELRRLALRYRNCARRYLPQVLDETDAFAEFVHEQGRAVIHLRREEGCWILEGLFAQDNGRVEPALRAAATTFLSGQGIRTTPISLDRGEWSVLRRLSGVHQFGF